MAEVRIAPSQRGQSCCDGAALLRHGFADRPRHAHDGEGPVAAQTRAGCGQLLDRATASRTIARNDERPVLGACPNSRCSILSESDSTLGYEQVFSPLEYRSDTAAAAECAGLRAERPCL